MNRAMLKQRGKAAFKANYWKTVLVAFLLSLALSTFSASVSSSVDSDELEQIFNEPAQSVTYEVQDPLAGFDREDINADFSALLQGQESYTTPSRAERLAETVKFGTLGGLGFLSTLISIFLLGPLEVGCRSFLKRNLQSPAELEEMNAGFVPKYWHNLATMLVKRIFIFLWSLLLIIPGVIMSYAYEMTPYILKDNPDLGVKETLDLSKAMMKGHKWELFVLDLSFLGWILLSIITLGIADIFYVHPYISSTHAAFYEELKAQYGGTPAPEVTDVPAEA